MQQVVQNDATMPISRVLFKTGLSEKLCVRFYMNAIQLATGFMEEDLCSKYIYHGVGI